MSATITTAARVEMRAPRAPAGGTRSGTRKAELKSIPIYGRKTAGWVKRLPIRFYLKTSW